MILSCILVFFVLHPGVMLQELAVLNMNVIAGEPVVLHCQDDIRNQNPTVVWKYKSADILQYSRGKTFYGKIPANIASAKLKDPDNGDFSLMLPPDALEGRYTCEIGGKQINIDLTLWKVKGSPDGYLLEGDTLQLDLLSANRKSVRVEWFSPQSVKVTSNKPRWNLQNDGWTLQIKDLNVEDNGTWKCTLPNNNLTIYCKVRVIGFVNSLDVDMRYAAVNSTVVLSCPLNIHLHEIPRNILTGLVWKKDEKEDCVVLNASSNLKPQKEISKVQFEDAGEYQCQLRFTQRSLNKTIQLVVLTVSASPPGLRSRNGDVNLCCHISAPVPPKVQLCWANMNETSKCASDFPDSKFCSTARTAELWRCSLKVENNEKISMSYVVEATMVKNDFPLIEVASGAGALLLLLTMTVVCVYTSKMVKRKRKAKRMAQAKRHLLEKKVCQCHKELTDDYYHT
ncbi:T-cell surface glycoprotein CD4 [Rhineura floridana]|uniref:T-cell surface glycoprotein CD4 n=1 Tax=Rhineura floridana TaxID=261503 RepID=UPI002AC7FFE9|nr:T-cell surface glycoprotein CD4 [Rhineura floridana]XP_061481272.1 T-cell surface glycoprotein CD4 [Rhineura floridana]